MAGRKLPVLPTLGEFPQADDKMYIVDVSDTSESPQGTSKQVPFGEIIQTGTYTPTITDEFQCVASITNIRYIDTGGIVQIFGDVRVDFDGGATSGDFKFDLATAIQPANNWSVSEDVGAVLQRTNGLFTNACDITADTGGSKLLICAFSDTTAGATIKATFIITYNKNN